LKQILTKLNEKNSAFPGMLDNFVGGGLTAGLKLIECAKKELEEEAGVTEELAKLIKPVDGITYAYEEENEEGVCIEGEFVFDILLPSDFIPTNTDGEVDSFYLMNVEQVMI